MRQDGILKSIRNKYPELEIRSLKIRISNGKKDDSPKVEIKQKESDDYHSANEDDIAGADRPENDSAFFRPAGRDAPPSRLLTGLALVSIVIWPKLSLKNNQHREPVMPGPLWSI